MSIIFKHLQNSGEWILRICIAALCGAGIGYERKNRNKEAGIRTHAIVAIGSALIMIVSKYGFYDTNSFDASRIAAQTVSGIGFLGAGIIFVKNGTVSGLTTAAGIWATAGVGMCIGSGLYTIGIITATLILGLQLIFHGRLLSQFTNQSQLLALEIIPHTMAITEIHQLLQKFGLDIHMIKVDSTDPELLLIDIECSITNSHTQRQLIDAMMQKSYVKSFHIR